MNLAPPPQSGNAAVDRWMFLLWRQLNEISASSQFQTTSANVVQYSTLGQSLLNSPQLGNIFMAIQSFGKPELPGLKISDPNDSQFILANQIFGG